MDLTKFYILAVAGAFYPAVLAIVMLLLPNRRATALLAAFLIGGLSITIVSGVVIVLVFRSTHAFSGSHRHNVSPVVNIAVGVFSLYAAWSIWRGRRILGRLLAHRRTQNAEAPKKTPKKGRTARLAERGSLPIVFLVGLFLDLPSVWYLAALKEITEGNPSFALQVALIISYALLVFLLVEIPLILTIVRPTQTHSIVTTANEWVKAHKRQLAIAIAGAIGVWQVIDGITRF